MPKSLQVILHSACECICQGMRGHVSGSQGIDIKRLLVSDRIILPDTVPLTVQALDPAGAYLLDSMRIFILWLGRNVSAEFMSQVLYILDQLLPTYWTNMKGSIAELLSRQLKNFDSSTVNAHTCLAL